MATTSSIRAPLENQAPQDPDELARYEELLRLINSMDSKKSAEAVRELSDMGYDAEQDPTGSDFIVKKRAGYTPAADNPRSGPLSERAATPTGPISGKSPGGPMRSGALSDRPASPTVINESTGAKKPRTTGLTPEKESDIRKNLLSPPTAPAAPVAPAQAGSSAYARGAPPLDDRVDSQGRHIPGAQTFVRGLFATADNAGKALAAYRKQNPDASPTSDPQLQQLQQQVNAATADATAGSRWAGMTSSARQNVLTEGERAAGMARVVDQSRSAAQELGAAQVNALATNSPTNLIEDGKYFNDTGVMRGGAGIGTSTTPGGGVVTRPVENGRLVPGLQPAKVTSPYGTGGITYLSPDQQAKRPEAVMDGMSATRFFDDKALRSGQTFDVAGKHYSPELSPEDYAQKQLEDAKRKAEEERKKFASSLIKR